MNYRSMFYGGVLIVILCAHSHVESKLETRYDDEAQEWSSQVMKEVRSQEELILILNLLYFSAQRSFDILTFEKLVKRYLHSTSALMHDTLIARRNPARLSSVMDYSTAEWESKLYNFQEAHDRLALFLHQYRANAAAYAHCLEHLIKHNGIRSELLVYINQLRDDARTARMIMLREQMSSVQQIKEMIEKIIRAFSDTTREMLHEEVGEQVMRSIVDTLSSWSEPAAVASYVKLDRKYMQFNDALWNTLIAGHNAYDLLWELLETTRAQFYKTHYDALVQRITPNNGYAIAFDAQGFIAPELRIDTVPQTIAWY